VTVTDDLDQVVALAGEVAALRQRLAELDAERVTIEGQIADRVNRIAAAAVAAGTPPSPAVQAGEWNDSMEISAGVLYLLRQSPDKVFTAPEIADGLQLSYQQLGSIRTHLSRMAKDGRVTRVRFGKYKAV
jgi:hypothetical protein